MTPTHLIYALLIIAIWGFSYIVIKIGLEGTSPFFFGFARFFITSIPAIFFIRRPAVPFKMIALYGLVMFALQFGLLFTGMYAGVTPSLAALLVQTQVFFTTLLAILFLDAKLDRWQVGGALIAFCGIVLVAINIGGTLTLLGVVLTISSAIAWSAGNLISKKIGPVNMFALVVWGSLLAWPPLLLLSLILDGPNAILSTIQHISWLSIGAILYIACLATMFGFGMWSYLLHHYRLPTVAPFTLLVPIVAMASSTLILGEELQTWKIIAALLVITGLCINLFGPRLFFK